MSYLEEEFLRLSSAYDSLEQMVGSGSDDLDRIVGQACDEIAKIKLDIIREIVQPAEAE